MRLRALLSFPALAAVILLAACSGQVVAGSKPAAQMGASPRSFPTVERSASRSTMVKAL